MRLLPLIRQLSIIEKESSALMPFPIDPKPDRDFGWAQRALISEIERQYNSGRPVRIIVLKARQLGMSTVTAAVTFLWAMMFENMQGLVLTHENDTTQSLFEKTQQYWDTWPWRYLYKAKHATQRRLVWSNGSSIRTATAGNRNAGVGRTIRALHTSEASRYPEPEALMGALRQALPKTHGTIEIVESTARGVGNWFHEEWTKAIEGSTSYVPMFFPWFKHYEYSSVTVGLADGLISPKRESVLDEEERRLLSLGASYEALEWRRWIIPNELNYDEDMFRQEYPATSEEAFLTSGSSVFDQHQLRSAYVPIGTALPDGRVVQAGRGDLHSPDGGHQHPEFISSPDGKLTVFRAPSPRPDNKLYVIGVDPTRTVRGDPACIQVINRSTHEQVAVWHGKLTANELAREVQKLGRWYHDAELCVEVGGGGAGVIAVLIEWGYPNLWVHRKSDRIKRDPGQSPVYGFLSNWEQKSWAVGVTQYLLAINALTIHDPITFHQMVNYTHVSRWEMGNADVGGHDDAVMALILACFADRTEPVYVPPEYRIDSDSSLEVFTQHGA